MSSKALTFAALGFGLYFWALGTQHVIEIVLTIRLLLQTLPT